MIGNCSGLAKRFHGWSKTRLSRILAGDPLAGWKKKRDKLLVLSVRNTLSVVYRTHLRLYPSYGHGRLPYLKWWRTPIM